ncbi:hypothetical protein FZZ85_07765 [Synechococcus sp. MU1642]|nr:hypothetical protein [Synechococcus sp. MU1642]
MYAVQELTVEGWSDRAEHSSKDNAFWHARARSDADGQTYRLISEEKHVVCLLTSRGSECWELD